MRRVPLFLFLFLCFLFRAPVPGVAAGELPVAIGFFPNLTHAPALIAQNMAAEGEGWFEQRVPGIRLKWVAFNAGPSAMDSLFAKAVNLTYVGPNPVLNAYIRSNGGVHVVAGAVRGGAALVVPKDSPCVLPKDFIGKRVATPQLGNTQDIACRNWFLEAGLSVTLTGGDVLVIPTSNAALFGLFSTGNLDAAWTVEPWVSLLELEAGGKVIYSEPAEESPTTLLAVSTPFAAAHPDVLKKLVEAHCELVEWIRENPAEAQQRVAAELSRQTRSEFPLSLVVRAWPRLVFDSSVTIEDFTFALRAAQRAGLMKKNPNISKLVTRP